MPRFKTEKERAEAAQFVARQGYDIRNVSDGWASLDAPRGAGVVPGQTLTFYRLTDRVRPAGSVKVVSAPLRLSTSTSQPAPSGNELLRSSAVLDDVISAPPPNTTVSGGQRTTPRVWVPLGLASAPLLTIV